MTKEKTPIIIALAGPVASGKSFITKNFDIRIEDPVYVNTDVIVRDMFGLNPTREQYSIGFKEADRIRDEALLAHRNLIIFESPFSNPHKIDYLSKARNEGHFSRVYYVGTSDPEINVRRNEQRRKKEHRGPPPEYVRHSWRDANANLFLTARVAHDCIVFDNSIDYRPEGGVPLFKTQDGLVYCQYQEELPRWGQASANKIGFSDLAKSPSAEMLKEDHYLITHEIARPPIEPINESVSRVLGKRISHTHLLWRYYEKEGTPKERYRKALDDMQQA